MQDRLGNDITIGCKVAYNQSGELAYGRVKDITASMRHGRPAHTYTIENLDGCFPWHQGRAVSTSKVKNARGMLVIIKADGTFALAISGEGDQKASGERSALEQLIEQAAKE